MNKIIGRRRLAYLQSEYIIWESNNYKWLEWEVRTYADKAFVDSVDDVHGILHGGSG